MKSPVERDRDGYLVVKSLRLVERRRVRCGDRPRTSRVVVDRGYDTHWLRPMDDRSPEEVRATAVRNIVLSGRSRGA